MVHGEAIGLKNGELVMGGILDGGCKNRMELMNICMHKGIIHIGRSPFKPMSRRHLEIRCLFLDFGGRLDTISYNNVCSKADVSQLDLLRGTEK